MRAERGVKRKRERCSEPTQAHASELGRAAAIAAPEVIEEQKRNSDPDYARKPGP